MERDILNHDGFPPGSSYVYLSLVELFPEKDWEFDVAALDQETPGGGITALRHIEGQRIYLKSGVAIVYTIVSSDWGPIFVLHTVNLYEGDPIDFLSKMLLAYP